MAEAKCCTITFTSQDWINAQQADEYCGKVLKGLLKSVNKVNKKGFTINETGLLVDKRKRVLVPMEKKEEVLELNHDHKAHLGIWKTLERIRAKYYWPKMEEDIANHVKNCVICARIKNAQFANAPLKPIEPASRIFERIAMDILGPVAESSRGNKYILVLSDYCNRYDFAIPIEDQKASTIA